VTDSHATDRIYWHRYTEDFYAGIFDEISPRTVLKFGTHRGESVRWLMEVFPEASITSRDILPPSPEWPRSNRVHYARIDQGNPEAIRSALREVNSNFDLVIEDGSHFPEHQKNSLIECLPYLISNSIYVVEDIHTSLDELRNPGPPASLGSRRGIPQNSRKTISGRFSSVLGRLERKFAKLRQPVSGQLN
jgi:cephalosporin hydroxylase